MYEHSVGCLPESGRCGWCHGLLCAVQRSASAATYARLFSKPCDGCMHCHRHSFDQRQPCCCSSWMGRAVHFLVPPICFCRRTCSSSRLRRRDKNSYSRIGVAELRVPSLRCEVCNWVSCRRNWLLQGHRFHVCGCWQLPPMWRQYLCGTHFGNTTREMWLLQHFLDWRRSCWSHLWLPHPCRLLFCQGGTVFVALFIVSMAPTRLQTGLEGCWIGLLIWKWHNE